MKKFLFGSMLLLSVAAIRASSSTEKTGYALYGENAIAGAVWNNITDTVPKDSTDTSRPHFYGAAMWKMVNDTVPKDSTDTTHKPQLAMR